MVRFKNSLKAIGLLLLLFAIDTIVQTVQVLGLSEHASWVQFTIVMGICLGLTYILLKPVYRLIVKNHEGFKLTKLSLEDVLYALIFVLLIFTGNMLISEISMLFDNAPKVANNQAALESIAGVSSQSMFGIVILALLIAPFIEEFMFRGVLSQFVTYGLPEWVQVMIMGMTFGLFHVLGQSWQWSAFIQYSWMGCILSLSYIRQRHLSDSILTHFTNNIFGVISLMITV